MRRHTTWLKSQVETVPAIATKTFVTEAKYPAPNQAVKVEPPYVVIHPFDGVDEQTRFTGPRTTQHPRFVIHSVGLDYNQAAAVGEAVKSKVVVGGFGIVPDVAGENSRSLTYEVPTGVQLDKDVSPPLCVHIAEVGWSADTL